MRYLKRQSLNRRIANDPSLYVDPTAGTIATAPTIAGNVVMSVTNSLVVPIGNTAAQPGSPVNGMIRYNSQTAEFEGYQSSKWRAFKYKEASPITQQNLGAGDGVTTTFGPLSTSYDPTKTSSNVPGSGGQSAGQFGGQNILVVVENVLQLNTTNYTVVQNPSVTGQTYNGTLSAAAGSGSTVLYFSTSLPVTSASSSGSVSVTGFIGNGSGAASGTILSVTSGTGIAVGMTLSGSGVTSTQVTAVNNAVFTGYISGTTLTVTALTSSAIGLGLVITGGSISAGTFISAFGTGTGGTGNYTVNNSQTVASVGSPITITGSSFAINVPQQVASGSITGSGTSVTLGFATQGGNPFAINDVISVTGMTPVGYNGTYTVTASTTSSVTFASTTTGTMTVGGTITSNSALFPATVPGSSIYFVGATVTGSANLQAGTTVSSYTVDAITGALTSITLNNATITATIAARASITITEATQSGSGYFLQFTSPVPYGKVVTALLGFDQ